MPTFALPFSGSANDRKLTEKELVRAIRFMVAAEYEATQLYLQLAESTDNKLAVNKMRGLVCGMRGSGLDMDKGGGIFTPRSLGRVKSRPDPTALADRMVARTVQSLLRLPYSIGS